MASPDPDDRIRGVRNIGRRNDNEFDEILKRIYKEDPDKRVKDAAKMLLKHKIENNTKTSFNSMIGDEEVVKDDKMTKKSESYMDINQRDVEAQIEENEEYLDDIIAGLYM